ncbi:MAG: hypothetical protein JSW42_08880 [Chloroflexota bacterium]|nr:MAG: hypothetical protein JSW42_08880 [Chloroflexota bacterium]
MSSKLDSADSIEVALERLSMKLQQLEDQLSAQSQEIAALRDMIPNSNIISPKFLNRAFAVWGHYVAAGFIIAIPFICLISFFALIIMLFSQQQF